MRADRSPSTQSSPMTMGCDRQEHTSREQGGWEQIADVAYCLTIVGEEVDTRGYKRAVSNRQQVGLRATLAKPAHLPADSHSKESQHSTVERRAFDRSARCIDNEHDYLVQLSHPVTERTRGPRRRSLKAGQERTHKCHLP
eukprot:scaffold33206_cov55-Phaeocystis_antarctica.AAC.1